MLACIAPEQFETCRVTYAAPTPNTVLSNTQFYRCGYSIGRLSTMGVHVVFDIHGKPAGGPGAFGRGGSIHFQKGDADNARAIDSLINIERQLLEIAGGDDTICVMALQAALESGELRGLLPAANDGKSGVYRLVLKVPGVWRSAEAQGLVYKLMSITRQS